MYWLGIDVFERRSVGIKMAEKLCGILGLRLGIDRVGLHCSNGSDYLEKHLSQLGDRRHFKRWNLPQHNNPWAADRNPVGHSSL